MKNIQTKNILVALCVLVAILITAIVYAVSRPQEKISTALTKTDSLVTQASPEMPKNDTAQVETAANNVQADCASQASGTLSAYEEWADDRIDSLGVGISHPDFYEQNHYNQSLNKCFVLILDNINDNQTVLFDAYQNQRLATCAPDNSLGDSSYLGSYPARGTAISYISYAECNSFVNQKMEANQ